jgi:hypothetical protein
MSWFHPVNRRSGVTSKAAVKNTRPSNPVVRIAKLTSLTPSWPRAASHASSTPGTAAQTITNRFANLPSMNGAAGAPAAASEVDIEIESRVEARDLLAVAVEHEGLAAARLADPLLGRLAPARVVMARIDVGGSSRP